MSQDQFIPILNSSLSSKKRGPLYFFHGYDPQYWDGLTKYGFLNSHSGVKLTQIYSTPIPLQFNALAALRSKLDELLQTQQLPFYIDRLQGGIYFHEYPYDLSLFDHYKQILGDKFLGVQMHEWASNYRDDWIRIIKELKDVPKPWTAQQIRDAILKISKDPAHINLSSGKPELFENMTEPQNLEIFIPQLYELYRLRQKETNRSLIPADSYYMAPKIEIESGSRVLLPEVGAQIPFTRVQIALTRGMANLNQLHWGAYYECWGGKPFSVSYPRQDGINEWYIDQQKFDFDFASFGENGGSSRALQRRLFYYLLMSGAEYLAEEWGVGNTFYDWKDFALTEYGQIKLDFIHFAEKYQDIPIPYTPIAIILQDDFPIIDIQFLHRDKPLLDSPKYLNFKVNLNRTSNSQLSAIKDILSSLFGRKRSYFPYNKGNESHIMTNSGFPDLFDIIYLPKDLDPNTLDALSAKYSYLIVMSLNPSVAQTLSQSKSQIISYSSFNKIQDIVRSIMNNILPVSVSSSIHWFVNWDGNSNLLYLSLFNNNGVERQVKYGDQFHETASITGIIEFQTIPSDIEVVKSWPDKNFVERVASTQYKFRIHAGGFSIFRIVLSKNIPPFSRFKSQLHS